MKESFNPMERRQYPQRNGTREVCGVYLTDSEIKTIANLYKHGNKIMVAAVLAITNPHTKGQLNKIRDIHQFRNEILNICETKNSSSGHIDKK